MALNSTLHYRILVIHGSNLNLLGTREPSIYGRQSLSDIEGHLHELAQQAGHTVLNFQSNCEGVLVDRIQQAAHENIDYIIINAAAFTHTSVAIADALSAIGKPFTEVHLSNVYKREAFRHQSFLAPLAVGVICGFGASSYTLALQGAFNWLEQHPSPAS